MSLTRFPNGLSSFGMPVLGNGSLTTTGNVFFVHNSTGSDGNSGEDPDHPFSTLDYAVGKCTADKGDIIILMPGSNESVTSTIAVDVAGISIVGLGHGARRPRLTQGTSSSDNVMEVSVSSIYIENIYFVGSTTGTNEVFIDVAGDDFTCYNCRFDQNTKNLNAVTIATGGQDDVTFDGCKFYGVAAGANGAIWTEGSLSRLTIRNCYFNYEGSAGCDDAVIAISTGSVAGALIENCRTVGLVNGEDWLLVSGAGSQGLVANCYAEGADYTDLCTLTGGLGYINHICTENAKGVSLLGISGGFIPIPLATPTI